MIEGVRRIAVFRALQLGDLLVAVPALRALRAGYPDAEITFIGLPWAASFAAHLNCYVDRFLPFPGYPGIAEAPYDEDRTAAFLAEARAHGYDLVVQMHGSGGQSNPFALALGARATAGYYEEEPPPGLTVAAPYPHDQPEALRNLGLVALLGCPDSDPALEFPLSDTDHAEAAALLAPPTEGGRLLVGIHPGARPPARRWPAACFAAVADALARRHGAAIVLTGGPGDEETVATVARTMAIPALNVAGRTSLGGLAALIARMNLFIGNDSGPAHLAEAVGAPSVRIFGPADPLRWAPLDRTRHAVVRRPVPCSPCPYWECPIDHPCLRLIEPRDVLRAAESVLATSAGSMSGQDIGVVSVGISPVTETMRTGEQRGRVTMPLGKTYVEESQQIYAREDLCDA